MVQPRPRAIEVGGVVPRRIPPSFSNGNEKVSRLKRAESFLTFFFLLNKIVSVNIASHLASKTWQVLKAKKKKKKQTSVAWSTRSTRTDVFVVVDQVLEQVG